MFVVNMMSAVLQILFKIKRWHALLNNIFPKLFLFVAAALLSINSYAAPTIKLQPVYAQTGENVTVKVMLSGGTEAYGGINARVELPTGYAFVSAAQGELLASGTYSLFAQSYDDSTGKGVGFVIYSSADTFQNNGHLLDLVLSTPSDASLGKTALTFETDSPITAVNVQHAVSDAQGDTSLAHSVESGLLYVISSTSDLDNDGTPDAVDTDDDNDGIPDVYELANNLDPFVQDGQGDLDNDGFDNATEYQQGTDIADANNTPTEVSLALSATVTSVTDPNNVLGNITVDSLINGALAILSPGGIDQQALNNNVGEYYQSSTHASLSLEVGGLTFASQAGNDVMIQIDDGNTNGDVIFVAGSNDASSVATLNSYDVALTLGDSIASAFSSDSVPETIPAIESFDTKTILISGKDSQNASFEIVATITSFSAVTTVSLDVDGDDDADSFDLLLIQRHVGGVSNLLTNIQPATGVGGSGANGARTNDEIRTAIDQIQSLINLDVDGDADSDSFDLLIIQRHVGGVSNLLTNIQPAVGVGGSGSNGARTNDELRTAIDALLGN